MPTILRLDSSARHDGSTSRMLGDLVENTLVEQIPDSSIIHRDLADEPLPHLDALAIAGFFSPPDALHDTLKAAIAQSDELVEELLAADMLILTVPMYNFAVPSALKAWIDHVVRIGRTFSYDGQSFAGLLQGKKAYVVCAYGATGYGVGEPFGAANFVEPYLRFVLTFLGITQTEFFSVEATSAPEDARAPFVEKARETILQALRGAQPA